MKPRVLIMVDTYNIGGPGKVILQFFTAGGPELSDSIVAGFWRGPIGRDTKWQFREAVEKVGGRFEVLPQSFAFDPRCIFSALKIIRENKIQVLQSHGYKAHVVCWALRFLTSLPWMGFVHGWTSENIKIHLYNFSEKLIVRFANRIVPVSEELKNRVQLGARALKRTTVITNAADFVDTTRAFPDKRAELGVGADQILISLIGRLSPEKGLVYFVEAMALLVKKFPNLRAVIVGEGQERPSIEAAIKRLELGSCVFMVGYQEDVSPYYNAADIVCMPSLSEGMPNVALEAMMFAKPVVASRAGGIPEVVVDGETGYMVALRDPVALAQALEKVVCDEKLRTQLGLNGKQRVEKFFDPRVRVERIVTVVRELMGDST